MATVVVLLLISIALALSYSIMRSQSTALVIHYNADRRFAARQAAVTGMTMALKKMHTSQWAGVDTTLGAPLNEYENYTVTYTPGDPSLTPDDPDYADHPYRVTLLSTGYAVDPADPSRVSTHQVRSVVRLVPRKLEDEPKDWDKMQQYTVYQTKKDKFSIDIPCQLEGRIRVQGKLKIAEHYPDHEARWRYLGDLNKMRLGGRPDYRPFTTRVDLPYGEQDGEQLLILAFMLGVTAIDTPVREAASDWTQPTSLANYQVYEGGPVYTIPTVGTIIQNVTLEADPLTNPLGIYYCGGALTVADNVTIRGSLFCRDDLRIEGSNVRFEPVELPGLHGSEGPVRLPVVSCHKLVLEPTARGTIAGLVAVFDDFLVEKAPDTQSFTFTGRVITRKLHIKERQPWETIDWDSRYEAFKEQLGGLLNPGVPYFPVWMAGQGRDPKPLLLVKPDSTTVTYHWENPQNPVYVPHPDDDGLRWDVLEWTENP